VTGASAPSLQAWRLELEALEDACPWPGPRPLRDKDQALLCGRDGDRRAFREEVDTHRLVLLTGASGVGKTSLLRAGLVPSLRDSGYLVAVCRNWTGSAQETDSLAFLARMVSRELEQQNVPGLPRDASLFWHLEQRLGERTVLVLDQFEELIRDARDFKDDLYEVLSDINHRTSIKVVVSFRSEYLHELRALESRARPFTISHYFLEEVDPVYARDLVEAGNSPTRVAIDKEAVEEVVNGWTQAVTQRSTTAGGRERVGLLHLQALLYALDHAAGHGTITPATIGRLRRVLGAGRTDASLTFWGGLRAAVEVKLARCRAASSAVGLDEYLIEGTAQYLARSVRHLSSAGYKLVRDAWDLADTTLGGELESLRAGVELCSADDGVKPDGPVTGAQLKALFETLIEAIQYQDDAGGDDAAPDRSGGESVQLDLLSATRETIAQQADAGAVEAEPEALPWVQRQHPGGPPLTLDRIPVTCGPMFGMAPAAVLIEEMRRFAFALEWLQASSLVRLNTPVTGGAMVALIHDGFGSALERWSQDAVRQASGALHALTAPRAAEFEWIAEPDHDDTRFDGARAEEPDVREILNELDLGSSFVPQLDGAWSRPSPTRPDRELDTPPARLLVNLRWRGALVHAAFRQVGFVNCDLRGTIFRRCLFDGATFVNCLLDGVIFDRCVIAGVPAPHSRAWKVDAPTFRVRVTDDTPGVLAQYRGLDSGPPVLFSQAPGLPALPTEAAPESINLGVQPGGLAVYGGRVSSLVARGCSFRSGGVFRLRDTAGSGLDIVEIGAGGTFEIVGSRLRHITFTSQSIGERPGAGDCLSISIVGSSIAQLWIGDDLTGTLDIDDSMLVHLWNGAPGVTAQARKSAFHGLVNVELVEECTPMIRGEAPVPLAVVDRAGEIAKKGRGMDYQENPSLQSRKAEVPQS
jgi:hypothetical protein